MHYTLLGFTQHGSMRRFTFLRVIGATERVRFDVSADLALARKWNIAVQELPALCTTLLHAEAGERACDGLSLSEADLRAASEKNQALEAERVALQTARSQRAALASRAASAKRNTSSVPRVATAVIRNDNGNNSAG